MKHIIVATSTAVVLAAALVATDQRVSAAEKPAAKGTPVTLTGCLRADGDHYKLTSLQGDNIPKSRTWKSGYLKKSTREYQVVTTTPAVKLKDHVNHQVTLTGTADGGWQLRARSVKHVAPSCS